MRKQRVGGCFSWSILILGAAAHVYSWTLTHPSHDYRMPGPSRRARQLAWRYGRGAPWQCADMAGSISGIIEVGSSFYISLYVLHDWYIAGSVLGISCEWLHLSTCKLRTIATSVRGGFCTHCQICPSWCFGLHGREPRSPNVSIDQRAVPDQRHESSPCDKLLCFFNTMYTIWDHMCFIILLRLKQASGW